MALPPRLLTDVEAAAYLGGLPLTSVGRLPRGRVTIDGKPRWDRLALDRWIDELSGLESRSAPAASAEAPRSGQGNDNENDPEAALERFRSRGGHDPRRP